MNTIIVVLGNKTASICMSRANSALECRAKLLAEDPLQHIWFLLSGANGEAEFMRDCITYHLPDFPQSRIIIDSISRNTYQNIVNSYSIVNAVFSLEQHEGMPLRIVFCSSGFHIKRVVVISKFLNSNNYNISYHYTADYIDRERDRIESLMTDSFLDNYCFN